MSAWDYKRSTHKGGGNKTINTQAPRRNPENERDLGMAIEAKRRLGACLAKTHIEGKDTTNVAQRYEVAKGIMWLLQGKPLCRATDRQRAFLMKVIGLDALPPIADPIPAACRVLPMKPPAARTKTGTDD